MRLLLDTHIWLWSLLEPDRLTPAVVSELKNSANELWLSAITVWETRLLAERGRLDLDSAPADWIDRQLGRFPLRDAPVTRAVASAAGISTSPPTTQATALSPPPPWSSTSRW